MKPKFLIILNFILVVCLLYLIDEYKNLYKQLEDLNKLPKEVEFCSDYANVLHFRHVKFNEYEETTDVTMNNDGTCSWMNTYINLEIPSISDFSIGDSDKNVCNKIKLKCEKLDKYQ